MFVDKPSDIYKSMLNDYKASLKTNRYARELELKYHKSNHIQQKPSINKKPTGPLPQWPIDSAMFTKMLQLQLQKPMKANSKQRHQSISKVRLALKSAHRRSMSSSFYPSSESICIDMCKDKGPMTRPTTKLQGYSRCSSVRTYTKNK